MGFSRDYDGVPKPRPELPHIHTPEGFAAVVKRSKEAYGGEARCEAVRNRMFICPVCEMKRYGEDFVPGGCKTCIPG